jgi:hypothetical protein
MESFNTDQSVNQEQQTDQSTFKVGDRDYDADSAAKKISAADQHIAKIEQENKEFREKMAALEAQVQQSTKLDEALQKLQSKADVPEVPLREVTPSLDAEKLSEAARQAALEALQAQQEEQKAQEALSLQESTFNATQAKLVALYGNDIDTAIQEKAGISLDTALQMAKDPEQSKVLLKIMEVESKPTLSPQGDINTASLNSHKKESIFGDGPVTTASIEAAYRRAME